MYFPVEFTKYNWAFRSTSQTTACLGMEDEVCLLPRGRGVGGSTLINGLVYARGSKLDFDKWAEIGNPGWSYDDVLPLFKKSEDFHHRDPQMPVDYSVHGTGGLLNVEYHLPRSPHLNVFLRANEIIGNNITDYNAGTGLGASSAQINTKNGVRCDDGKAFVRPVLRRPNLRFLTNSYATKVIINDNNVAKGVLFARNNKLYRATARKEVILAAGAYQSAQLLMLSGIGPRDHLESLGIDVKSDLQVGTFLDHPTFYGLNFGTNYTEPIKSMSEYVCEYLKGYGPLAAPGNNQGVSFFESSFTRGTGLPDIEIMMIPSNATARLSQRSFNLRDEVYETVWGHEDPSSSFVFYVVCLHALSEGTIRLNSTNPYDYPIIDPRYLSDPHNKDIDTIYEGIELAFQLVDTEPFRKINTTLQGGPLEACSQYEYRTRDYWYCAIRQVTMDIYHPVGSAKMGPNPDNGDVVNHECKVHGIRNLRVADASVFPFTLAGHPNAPTVVIGEKVSELIKAQYL